MRRAAFGCGLIDKQPSRIPFSLTIDVTLIVIGLVLVSLGIWLGFAELQPFNLWQRARPDSARAVDSFCWVAATTLALTQTRIIESLWTLLTRFRPQFTLSIPNLMFAPISGGTPEAAKGSVPSEVTWGRNARPKVTCGCIACLVLFRSASIWGSAIFVTVIRGKLDRRYDKNNSDVVADGVRDFSGRSSASRARPIACYNVISGSIFSAIECGLLFCRGTDGSGRQYSGQQVRYGDGLGPCVRPREDGEGTMRSCVNLGLASWESRGKPVQAFSEVRRSEGGVPPMFERHHAR